MSTRQGSHCPAVSASPEALPWRLQHFKPLLMNSAVPHTASLLPCCLFPMLLVQALKHSRWCLHALQTAVGEQYRTP